MNERTGKDKVIIANCSGFFGDRLSAAKEMVQGGPIDFLTGDYLAELTMAILFRTKMKDPNGGYVPTFLRQMEQDHGRMPRQKDPRGIECGRPEPERPGCRARAHRNRAGPSS